MTPFKDYRPSGVIPATLAAFNDDMSLNEPATRSHLSQVAAVEGISSITVNGHASEVHACSFEEQQRILAFSLDEIGDRVPLVNGKTTLGSAQQVVIVERYRAGLRGQRPHDGAQKGCLAGPVAPDQAAHGARRHLQGQAAQDGGGTDVDVQAVDFEHQSWPPFSTPFAVRVR